MCSGLDADFYSLWPWQRWCPKWCWAEWFSGCTLPFLDYNIKYWNWGLSIIWLQSGILKAFISMFLSFCVEVICLWDSWMILQTYQQVKCFNAPLQTSEIVGIKKLYKKNFLKVWTNMGLLWQDSYFFMPFLLKMDTLRQHGLCSGSLDMMISSLLMI